MPSRLRNRPRKNTARPFNEFAVTLESLAKRIEDASHGAMEEQANFARFVARAWQGEEERAKLSAAQKRNLKLIGFAPIVASTALTNAARFTRCLDDCAGAEFCTLPNVNIRQKKAPKGERFNVQGAIDALVDWTHQNDPKNFPSHMPVEGIAFVALHYKDHAPADVLRNDTRRKLAVRRALHELTEGIDTPAKRAIRSLAQAAFDAAGALDTIVQRIAYRNPDEHRFVQVPNLVRSMAKGSGPAGLRIFVRLPDLVSEEVGGIGPLSLPTALTTVAWEIYGVSVYLRKLDKKIREIWLTAPHDHGKRGRRFPRTLYLAVIRELERGGFTDQEIAALVADESGGTMRERVKRVGNNLDRYKQRIPRTYFVPPAPTDTAHPKR